MFELTSLVVAAVAQACESAVLAPGDVVEVTYRRYRYDPPSLWFLEIAIAREASWQERALLMSA